MVNEYKTEADILKGLEMAKKSSEHEQVDWNSEEERKLYLSEQYIKDREKKLDRLTPNRVCPCCKRKIWLTRMWVVEEGKAFCRSCYYCKVHPNKEVVIGGFLKEVVVRFEIDGWKLRAMRMKCGVGATAFAARMGWSRTYLYRVEGGYIKTLNHIVVDNMIDVFDSFNIKMINERNLENKKE